MRVRWATPDLDAAGNAFGYSIFSTALREAMQAAGAVFDDTAPLALHVAPPMKYAPIPGTTSAVFSMWESAESFPVELRPRLHEADLVIVPSAWNVPIFRAVTAAPVERCPLGITPADFPYVEREPPSRGEPFTWLAVGAPNGRKGFDAIEACWPRYFANRPDMLLYLKTTAVSDAGADAAKAAGWQELKPGLFQMGNTILDTRVLARADLVKLYQAAHAFLFPTGGEGWGLTLHEALATGLPAVCTHLGGHLDFTSADTVTYVAPEMIARMLESETTRTPLVSAWVPPDRLAVAMLDVMARYRHHLRAAKRGSRQVRLFTWQRAGQRLVEILRRFQQHRVAA